MTQRTLHSHTTPGRSGFVPPFRTRSPLLQLHQLRRLLLTALLSLLLLSQALGNGIVSLTPVAAASTLGIRPSAPSQ
ncbi:MAG TPA: hypothetical protein VNE38_18580, partial [Ktedonobacteraceae bacterium]|nr:hypothetical protein [Ktedonobacteraceae bacterium]